MRSTNNPQKSEAYRYGAVALMGAVLAIGTALAFEYVGGVKPCPLCVQQRWAYYAAIPALFIGLILLSSGKTTAGGLIFLLVSIAFLVNGGLGVYHAGIEYGFWPGPETCSGTPPKPTVAGGTILDRLGKNQTPIPRCDVPAKAFLGLSFAVWNVIASVLLWITSQSAAFASSKLRSA